MRSFTATTAVQGDADACAIWISEADVTKSAIIGNDKTKDGALYIWDLLSGQEVYRTPAINQPVNPSIRQGVIFGDKALDIVGCGVRSDNTARLFSIDPKTRELEEIANVPTGFDADTYGFTLYLRPDDGQLFAFVSQKKKGADIHQLQLGPDGSSSLVRSFGGKDQKSYVEGMAVDDELGFLYCADETGGILKYYANPKKKDDELVASFATDDGIEGDREGLALYLEDQGTGYLALSSQGNGTIKVYARDSNAFIKSVQTDLAKGTDGIAANPTPLSPLCPEGVLVCHDAQGNRFVTYSWKDLDLSNP